MTLWWLLFQWVIIVFGVFFFSFCVILRIIRRYWHFPIPAFLTRVIDNPIRRRIVQKPTIVAQRMELAPGMIVVEVGPGKGNYTKAFAEGVFPNGVVYAVDIQESVIERLTEKIKREHIPNIIPQIDDAHNFSFDDESIDRIVAIACLPEIPEPVEVLQECHRILKSDGLLSLCELAPDPDYPRRKTEKRWAEAAGFTLYSEYGTWFSYQLNFKKRVTPS